MIAVKVAYTVDEQFVNRNIEMIQSFLTDFKALDSTQFDYSVFQSKDNITFTHVSKYANKEVQSKLLGTPSFLHFQEQRDKHLTSEPRIEILNFIGSSENLAFRD
jgi:quinol monooxygenase YgiN